MLQITFATVALVSFASIEDSSPIPWPAIEKVANAFLQAESFPSLALGIAIGDRVEYRTFGRLTLAPDAKTPTVDTLYEIGSISKTYTGVLFADAVTRGVFALDAGLADHVPEGTVVPDEEETAITLAMLSNHSSALPRMPGNFMPRDGSNPYADYDAKRLYDALSLVTLNRNPGTRYEYSNYAVGLLGQILVDECGATSYEALLRDRLLAPLEFRDTFITLDAKQIDRLAPGHTADLEPTSRWDFLALAPAGAIRASIQDLLKWGRVQYASDESPLGKAITLSHQLSFEDTTSHTKVGLGWHISPIGVLWHNGQTGGYHSYLGIAKEQRIAVAGLGNAGTGDVDKVADYALALCMGKTPAEPVVTQPVEVSEKELDALAGTFRLQGPVIFTIVVEKDGLKRPKGLWAQLTGQPSVRVYPESATRFRYRVVDAALSFEVENGLAKAVTLHQNGRDQRCERINP